MHWHVKYVKRLNTSLRTLWGLLVEMYTKGLASHVAQVVDQLGVLGFTFCGRLSLDTSFSKSCKQLLGLVTVRMGATSTRFSTHDQNILNSLVIHGLVGQRYLNRRRRCSMIGEISEEILVEYTIYISYHLIERTLWTGGIVCLSDYSM